MSYLLMGQLDELSLPPAATSERANELWRHTCFEAFVQTAPSKYYEFNFAPTTAWAAYRFSGYRSGQSSVAIPAPLIVVQSDPGRYRLQASLKLDSLSPPEHPSWHLGLAAVIEDKNGRLSYWALAHASDKPDFHHPDSFMHEFFPAVPS